MRAQLAAFRLAPRVGVHLPQSTATQNNLQVRAKKEYPRNAKLTIDGTGNAIAVWAENDDRDVHRIWANRYVRDKGWETAVPIDNGTANAYLPQVAANNQGNTFAVWVQSDGASDSIFSSHYVPGEGWTRAVVIEDNTVSKSSEDPHPYANLAVDNKGNAIAIWYQRDEDSNDGIWANHYLAGRGWGQRVQISDTKFDGSAKPQIAIDKNGSTIAVWEQQDDGVWSARYAAGRGWQPTAQISGKGRALFPQLGLDGTGNAIVVWATYGILSTSSIHYNVWTK